MPVSSSQGSIGPHGGQVMGGGQGSDQEITKIKQKIKQMRRNSNGNAH
jgi:hypothetical protein